jgi:hypothetical protein
MPIGPHGIPFGVKDIMDTHDAGEPDVSRTPDSTRASDAAHAKAMQVDAL